MILLKRVLLMLCISSMHVRVYIQKGACYNYCKSRPFNKLPKILLGSAQLSLLQLNLSSLPGLYICIPIPTHILTLTIYITRKHGAKSFVIEILHSFFFLGKKCIYDVCSVFEEMEFIKCCLKFSNAENMNFHCIVSFFYLSFFLLFFFVFNLLNFVIND